MNGLDELMTLDWGSLGGGLKDVLVDPASNLMAFILLLAVIAVAGLIVIIILMLVLTESKIPQPRRTRILDPEVREWRPQPSSADRSHSPRIGRYLQRLPRWVRSILIGLIIVMALYVCGVYSGSDSVCADACHASSVAVEGNHRDVRCVDCHEGRGIDRVVAVPRRMAHVLTTGLGLPPEEYPEPSSRACISCHPTAVEAESSRTTHLRMSHSGPLSAGLRCLECHQISHDQSDRLLPGTMQTCIRCHDDQSAPAECSLCHVGDPAGAVWAQGDRRHYSKVPTREKYSCEGCHDQASCDACHGLRLPHSEEFISGGHARESAFDGKEVCWKCHTRDFCMNACHRELEPHGPNARWKVEHGRGVPYNAPCACHSAMYPKPPDVGFCPLCHETRPPGAAPSTQ